MKNNFKRAFTQKAFTKKAFTLVEMSVVIVIVGLIVAAIVAGQEVIESSKRGQIVSDMIKYKSAIDQFKTRYNMYPGDMIDADTVFSLTKDTKIGNGNGRIDLNNTIPSSSPLNTQEFYFAPLHLVKAKMLDGGYDGGSSSIQPGVNLPEGPFNDSIYRFVFDNVNSVNRNYIEFVRYTSAHAPALSPDQASTLDQRLDDGKPSTGNFFGVTVGSNACTSSGEYNFAFKDKACRILYNIDQ